MRQWVKRYQYVNLIGATADDVRDIMITGESGILAICPKDERPRYVANKRMLAWPNGAISLLFTAEEPDRFRGKQHMETVARRVSRPGVTDRNPGTQASLGLRLGDRPQAVITTTPRPIKIIKDLIADPTTKVTRGSTYDNVANLADAFIKTIVKRYEGATWPAGTERRDTRRRRWRAVDARGSQARVHQGNPAWRRHAAHCRRARSERHERRESRRIRDYRRRARHRRSRLQTCWRTRRVAIPFPARTRTIPVGCRSRSGSIARGRLIASSPK